MRKTKEEKGKERNEVKPSYGFLTQHEQQQKLTPLLHLKGGMIAIAWSPP